MTNPDFAEWIKKHPPPDLQELVRRFGGYPKITPQAWADYDQGMVDWQRERRDRLK